MARFLPDWAIVGALFAVLSPTATPSAGQAISPATPSANGPIVKPLAEMGSDGKSIVYDGQVIRLSRSNTTFEEYEDDPNNIAPSENEHVEHVMTQAKLPTMFSGRAEAFATVSGLAFPGYGVWSLQPEPSPGQSELAALVFEIPRSGKSRYVAITGTAKSWSIIDDFVASDALRLRYVRRRESSLTYSDRDHKAVLEHVAPVGISG